MEYGREGREGRESVGGCFSFGCFGGVGSRSPGEEVEPSYDQSHLSCRSTTPQKQEEEPAVVEDDGEGLSPRTRRRVFSPSAMKESEGEEEDESSEEEEEVVEDKKDDRERVVERKSILCGDSFRRIRREEEENKQGLRCQGSTWSLNDEEEDWEAFEECDRSIRRADRSAVRFDIERNSERIIEAVSTLGSKNEDCYWQPQEYAAMSESRLRLELRVQQTGGRLPIAGESRRGLGLVCEPGTRALRATKIMLTQRAILRRHHEGASAGQLARFASERSEWAKRNALVCAKRDHEAAVSDQQQQQLIDQRLSTLERKKKKKKKKAAVSSASSKTVVTSLPTTTTANGASSSSTCVTTTTRTLLSTTAGHRSTTMTTTFHSHSAMVHVVLDCLEGLGAKGEREYEDDGALTEEKRNLSCDATGLASMLRNDSLKTVANFDPGLSKKSSSFDLASSARKARSPSKKTPSKKLLQQQQSEAAHAALQAAATAAAALAPVSV